MDGTRRTLHSESSSTALGSGPAGTTAVQTCTFALDTAVDEAYLVISGGGTEQVAPLALV